MKKSAFLTETLLVQRWSFKSKISGIKKEGPLGEFSKQHSCAQINIPHISFSLQNPFLQKALPKTHYFLQNPSCVSLQILIDQTLQGKDLTSLSPHVAHNQLKEQACVRKKLKQSSSREGKGLERRKVIAFNAKNQDQPLPQDWEAGGNKERRFRIEAPHFN